ncbi:unnamed protein product [Onchocerca flexuosa]|uniref:DUF4753 domain-containing protein n=1 Tax=Onchocerca flexuosa TaxID=387005 RepID=A0A183I638_9BILA|nr:unnamed protein product [Onchocerca flexuosa]
MKRRKDSGNIAMGRNALVRTLKTLFATFYYYALGLFNYMTYTFHKQYRNVCFTLFIS